MSCFVCNCADFGVEFDGRRINGYELRRCRGCGVVTIRSDEGTSPGQAIFEDYGDYLTTAPDTANRTIARIRQRERRRFAAIRATFGPDARLLDFGCGAGFWVEAARQSGLNCTGVEVSRHLAEFSASRFGHTPFRSLHEVDGTFDVIYMDNVIEHLDETLSPRLMAELLDRLRPNGLFFGRTPNYDSWNTRILGARDPVISPPSHSVYFNPDSLDRYLNRLGLKRESIAASGLNVVAFFRPRPDHYSFIERPRSTAQRLLGLAVRVVGKVAALAATALGGGYMIEFAYRKTSETN